MRSSFAFILSLFFSGTVFAQFSLAAFDGTGMFQIPSDASSVSPVPKVSAFSEVKSFVRISDLFKNVGKDITVFVSARKHKEIHLTAIKGMVLGETPLQAITSLGLLGCGTSALVGSSSDISDIYSALTNYYYRDSANSQPQIHAPGTKPVVVYPASNGEKQQIIASLALIGNANYNVEHNLLLKKIGTMSVNFLSKIILNEREDFYVRRMAVIGLGGIQSNESVDAIVRCITAINKKHSRLFDEAFSFSAGDKLIVDTLSDKGKGPDALLTALMLALDAQLDGKAAKKALWYMTWYAGIRGNNFYKITYSSLDQYTEKGGNSTTYLAALYLLASRRQIPSKIEQGKENKKIYIEKRPEALKMLKVVENTGAPFFTNYECRTRRAFLSAYKYISGWNDNFVYQAGTQPPFPPYYFDDCAKQKADKLMFSIIEYYVVGGLEGKAVNLAIKAGARALSGYSLALKGYKIATNIYLTKTSAESYYNNLMKLIKLANE